MATIIVDESAIPEDERWFYDAVREALQPEHEVLIELQESAFVEHAIGTIRVYIENPAVAAVLGYVLKKVADVFIESLKNNFEKGHGRPTELIIYGPDGKILKRIRGTQEKSNSPREL